MNRKSSCRFLAIVLGAVLVSSLLIGTAFAGASNSSEITMPNAIDTPSTTISHDTYGDHEISSLGTADYGDAFTVDIAGSDNPNILMLQSESDYESVGSGSGEAVVDTEEFDPGTYALALEQRLNIQDIQPVIISGYDISVSHDNSVESGDELTVDVTVSEAELEGTPDNVEVAVWDDETVVREDATHKSGESYEATIPTGDLESGGTYNVYAVAQDDDEIEMLGEPEILAVSDESTVEISSDDTDNGDDGGDGDNGGDEGNGGDDGDESNGGQSGNGDNGSDDSSEQSSDDGQSSESDDSTTDSDELSDEGDDTTTDSDTETGDDDSPDSVIEPNQDDSTAESGGNDNTDESDTDEIPMTGVSVVLGALISIAVIRRLTT